MDGIEQICLMGPLTLVSVEKDPIACEELLRKFDCIILREVNSELGEERAGIVLSRQQKVLFGLWAEAESAFYQLKQLYASLADPTPLEWFEAELQADMQYAIFMKALLEQHQELFAQVSARQVLGVRKDGVLVTQTIRTGDQRKHPGFPYEIFPRPKIV